MQHDPRDDAPAYDPKALEEKWLPVWEELAPYRSDDAEDKRPRKYIMDMFSYPSGDLHMGHGEAYALADVVARYWRQQGFNVMHPVGWDSFGLPAENAAIKRGVDPREWTYGNIAEQKASMRRYATSVDWTRELATSDPEYYKWNQWLFLKLYEKGLAYRKESWVNWDPIDQTVLANEQVLADGTSDRSGAIVVKKKLTQWYFKITDYAQELLDDLDALQATWPARVVHAQRNWIGRSEGAHVDFVVEGRAEPITVYTTRPDTLYGATFMVVAADAALAAELVTDAQRPVYEEYVEQVRAASDIERLATDRVKTGVDLGVTATNPVNGEQIPVWASDYVLADYGTGAIMAVPAHDQRDLDFAKKFDLPVLAVVDTGEADPAETFEATSGNGTYVASGPLDGLTDKATAIGAIIEQLGEAGTGSGTVNFRLRDWLLSRQRYWGVPIPIIHCPACGEVPVPLDELPVELPALRGADLKPKGVSPLAAAEEWVNVPCPTCGGPAKRDSDTMDTFVDSSWYFLRYTSPGYTDGPFDPAKAKAWMPADIYIGGVEHAVLHLLYARFFTMVLRDMGMLETGEPFAAQLNQGQVINQGKKMSKSLGNGVNLGSQLEAFGVDAVRLTLVFAGPPEDDIDWADMSPSGSLKFLQRAWRLSGDVTSAPDVDVATGDRALRSVTHRTAHDAIELVDSHRFNVMVARVMELVNATRKAIDSGVGPADPAVREAVETVAILMSMVTPYVAEEMWERLGHAPSVAQASWPTVDEALLVQDSVVAVVQIQGKVKARLDVSPAISAADLEALAMADAAVVAAIDGRTVRKVVVREPKLVNIVV